MDEYGRTYVDTCKPLVVLSGLGDHDEKGEKTAVPLQRNGLKLSSTSSPVPQDLASRLLDEFQGCISQSDVASSPETSALDEQPLCFQPSGRTYAFPTRKAVPQASPTDAGVHEIMSPGGTALHSPLSPLSPGSSLFPDGIMTPLWMDKHRHAIPAFYLAFYVLSTDENMQSLHDNQLKQEIGAIKLRLDESSYKTRFGVVLLAENSIQDDSDLEDRLNNIKRTVKLDSKSGFFYIQVGTNRESLAASVRPIVSALRAPIMDYYRDMTKHARRKRDRGTSAAPSTPTSPGLSRSLGRLGWAARYEFKLGVFADFRQEFEVAARHYNAALDSLFHPEGFFETVTNWSPRWNETRKFADVIAVRFIRCQLQNGLPTSAVMFWKHYRSRAAGILNRKGKGTSDYGWRAWEARWSVIMAELAAGYPSSATEPLARKTTTKAASQPTIRGAYLPPEKQIQSDEPFHPWDNLHHSGYWYKLAVAYTKARRWLATKIPAEDRLPPGQSPAAAVARRSETYDTYMCPDPPEEYGKIDDGDSIHDELIIKLLGDAVKHFTEYDQARMVAFLRLSLGKQLLSTGRAADAHDILRKTWQENPWRQAHWWDLVRDAAMSLHMSSLQQKDIDMQIATLWELSHKRIRPADGIVYDFETLLESEQDEDHTVSLRHVGMDSFVSVTCLFDKAQGHAGEPIQLRIIIMNKAHHKTKPVALQLVEADFEGGLRIKIEHTKQPGSSMPSTGTEKATFDNVKLSESGAGAALWTGRASLLLSPGQTKVFHAEVIVREAGSCRLKSTSIRAQYNKVNIDFKSEEFQHAHAQKLTELRRLLPGIRTLRSAPQQIEVLPKPPKMELRAVNFEKVYYTDEKAVCDISISNMEAESAEVEIGIRLLGSVGDGFSMKWTGSTPTDTHIANAPLSWIVGAIEKSASRSKSLTLQMTALPADLSFEIRASYHLTTDPNTPITKITTVDAIVVRPFDASYSVAPRVQPDLWPEFFLMPEDLTIKGESDRSQADKKAFGISSRWSVSATLVSGASSDLVVSDVALVVTGVSAEGKANVLSQDPPIEHDQPKSGVTVAPKAQLMRSFLVDIQKADFDERRTISASARLDVSWRRPGVDVGEVVHTLLDVPRMSFPSGEPRVLASLGQPSDGEDDGAVRIDFTLENPSMHFLSFGITMELSEEYAFSGPKARTLNLLPMSRRVLKCSFVPLKRGVWMQPKLSILDLYFDKRLEVQATEGLRADADGLSIWIEKDDEEDADDADDDDDNEEDEGEST